MADDNSGFSFNTAFHSPIIPYLGIAGCEVDFLKNNNDEILYGLGIDFDGTNDGFPGIMIHVKPKINLKFPLYWR